MRFIESSQLSRLSALLHRLDVGDRIIQGRVELLSTEKSKNKKKLKQKIKQEMQTSPLFSSSSSPPLVMSSSFSALPAASFPQSVGEATSSMHAGSSSSRCISSGKFIGSEDVINLSPSSTSESTNSSPMPNVSSTGCEDYEIDYVEVCKTNKIKSKAEFNTDHQDRKAENHNETISDVVEFDNDITDEGISNTSELRNSKKKKKEDFSFISIDSENSLVIKKQNIKRDFAYVLSPKEKKKIKSSSIEDFKCTNYKGVESKSDFNEEVATRMTNVISATSNCDVEKNRMECNREYSRHIRSAASLSLCQRNESPEILVNLIFTLNQCFPDYEFCSTLTPAMFKQELSLVTVEEEINSNLQQVEKVLPGFLSQFWEAIRSSVNLESCELYSRRSSSSEEINPLISNSSLVSVCPTGSSIGEYTSCDYTDISLNSFFYFFFDKKQQKIFFFFLMSSCKFASPHWGKCLLPHDDFSLQDFDDDVQLGDVYVQPQVDEESVDEEEVESLSDLELPSSALSSF